MLMVNQYHSAYVDATSKEKELELLALGWTVVEPKKEHPKKEEEKTPNQKAMAQAKNGLIYKGKYLSQWVSVAKKAELIAIFDHFGIPYAKSMSVGELTTKLREFIREKKAEAKKNDGQ
jgi:hypothetical protein